MIRYCVSDCPIDGADAEVLLPRRGQSRGRRVLALPHRVREDQGSTVCPGNVGLHLPRANQGNECFWLLRDPK